MPMFLHKKVSYSVFPPGVLNTQMLNLTVRGSTLDLCRCHILTSNVDPRTVRITKFVMAVDPYHRYSNEVDRPD